MHVRDAVGEVAGEHAEPRADLEDDVCRVEGGEAADHAEDVVVDEEVLAELLLRADAHGSEKAAVALASICAASSAASSPRAAASAATVWTTFAGSFGRPRRGLRREVGGVGLGEQAVGGHLRAAARRSAPSGT